MNNLEKPKILANTFCNNGDKTENIPVSKTETNACSLEEGFPVINSIPVLQGGIPPKRKDFNGVFYLLSTYCLFLQNGGKFEFDNDVVTAIGGYPKDAVLEYITNDGYHIRIKSLIDNNTNAPTENNIKNPSKDPSGIYYWEDITTNMPIVYLGESRLFADGRMFLKSPYPSEMAGINLYSGRDSNSGGHINFNFNGQEIYGYTSRIVEDEEKKINLICRNGLKVNGIRQMSLVSSTFGADGSFYKIYDNGIVEQGGVSMGSADTSITQNVNFLIPMANTGYVALSSLNQNDSSSNVTNTSTIWGKTTTGLIVKTARRDSLVSLLFSWYVIGMKA